MSLIIPSEGWMQLYYAAINDRNTQEIYRAYHSEIECEIALDAPVSGQRVVVAEASNRDDSFADVLATWTHCFADFQLSIVGVRPMASDELVKGSAHGVVVELVAMGIYTWSLPQLEDFAPATGHETEFELTDRIWFNGVGQMIRIVTSVNNPQQLQ